MNKLSRCMFTACQSVLHLEWDTATINIVNRIRLVFYLQWDNTETTILNLIIPSYACNGIIAYINQNIELYHTVLLL